jgi:hypothetical protein
MVHFWSEVVRVLNLEFCLNSCYTVKVQGAFESMVYHTPYLREQSKRLEVSVKQRRQVDGVPASRADPDQHQDFSESALVLELSESTLGPGRVNQIRDRT